MRLEIACTVSRHGPVACRLRFNLSEANTKVYASHPDTGSYGLLQDLCLVFVIEGHSPPRSHLVSDPYLRVIEVNLYISASTRVVAECYSTFSLIEENCSEQTGLSESVFSKKSFFCVAESFLLVPCAPVGVDSREIAIIMKPTLEALIKTSSRDLIVFEITVPVRTFSGATNDAAPFKLLSWSLGDAVCLSHPGSQAIDFDGVDETFVFRLGMCDFTESNVLTPVFVCAFGTSEQQVSTLRVDLPLLRMPLDRILVIPDHPLPGSVHEYACPNVFPGQTVPYAPLDKKPQCGLNNEKELNFLGSAAVDQLGYFFGESMSLQNENETARKVDVHLHNQSAHAVSKAVGIGGAEKMRWLIWNASDLAIHGLIMKVDTGPHCAYMGPKMETNVTIAPWSRHCIEGVFVPLQCLCAFVAPRLTLWHELDQAIVCETIDRSLFHTSL
jgi:hypothetical protein